MSKFNFTTELINSAQHEKVLSIRTDKIWFLDDVREMSDYLLLLIADVKIIETIIGADRDSVRFIWRKINFVIHFECYGQSCWIEVEDNNEECMLLNLEKTINKKNKVFG